MRMKCFHFNSNVVLGAYLPPSLFSALWVVWSDGRCVRCRARSHHGLYQNHSCTASSHGWSLSDQSCASEWQSSHHHCFPCHNIPEETIWGSMTNLLLNWSRFLYEDYDSDLHLVQVFQGSHLLVVYTLQKFCSFCCIGMRSHRLHLREGEFLSLGSHKPGDFEKQMI